MQGVVQWPLRRRERYFEDFRRFAAARTMRVAEFAMLTR
jgi:hypothetical protein